MAVAIQVVLLSLSIQSLHVTTTTTDSTSTVGGMMSTTFTLARATNSTETYETMSTQNATGALSTDNQTIVAMTPTHMTVSTPESTPTPEIVSSATGPTATNPAPSTVIIRTTAVTASQGQMSTEPVTNNTTPERTTIMMMAETTIATSSMTPVATSDSGVMTTTKSTGAPLPTKIVGVYIAAGVVCGLVVVVVLFALGVWCKRRAKPRSHRRNTNPFATDEMDKLDPKERMSMHRPVSATVNADDDLAFVTFGTGSPLAGSHVDGIENPTYAVTTVNDEKKADETATGGGGNDGAATMPSSARLSMAGPDEGAVDKVEEKKQSSMRPQSGVSYTSNDIDGALVTLDVGTV